MRRALQPHTLSGLGWTAMLACPMRSVSRWTRPLLQAAAAGKICGMEHITKNLVWGLWNEGNLFSLTTDELAHFVSMHNGGQALSEDVRKKSSLVRQIEEMLSLEQQQAETLASAGREAGEGSGSSVTVTDYDNMDAALDEADEYGDWGPEPGFEQRRKADFLEVSPSRLTERFDALTPRSFQLLHSHVSPDVQLRRVCPNKLPGQSRTAEAFTLGSAPVDEANQHRFRRGFEWCLLNLWNLNLSGEINIGAGKVLYYRHIAKQNRNVLPIWSLQRHLHAQHPYAWFAIATDTNVSAMEQLAASMDMKLTQDATTSYKVMIRRMGQSMDCELNEQLQCSKVNLPWDRFMVTHYVRTTAPDLRFVVRARHPIKKRVADAYLEADILRSTRDSVHAVLSPELGEVTYCCERVMRRWSKRLECGIILQLVETKRTPVIITKAGDEGERLEYEWIAVLPEKAERLNIAKVSDELWSCGGVLAKSLEPGMEDLMIHSLTL